MWGSKLPLLFEIAERAVGLRFVSEAFSVSTTKLNYSLSNVLNIQLIMSLPDT
jgi:hypothetical protein